MATTLKYLLSGLTLFLCYSISFGQQIKIDSLLSVLKTAKADSNKVRTLNSLANVYFNTNPIEANKCSQQAFQLSSDISFMKGMAESCNGIARYYWMSGDYSNALLYLSKQMKIYEKIGDKSNVGTALGNIGLIYMDRGDYPKALDSYFKALKISEEAGDNKSIGRNLCNIGLLYTYLLDYPKSLDYCSRSLKIATEAGDRRTVRNSLGNIGNAYLSQGLISSDSSEKTELFKKAQDYYFKTLIISEELGDQPGITLALGNIGAAYSEQKDYTKALPFYFKALKIAEEVSDKEGIARNLGNIGSVYALLKKHKEGEDYLLRAVAISDSIGALNHLMEFQKNLSNFYGKRGQWKTAMEHYKKFIEARDTLFSEDSKKKNIRTEMNFEFEKREAVTKETAAAAAAIAQAESRKQKVIIWAVIAGLLLVLVFAGFVFRSLRVTRKQKEIIEVKSKETEEQKKIIEEKNKDITDSINYAKRIQQAKLPRKEEIFSSLPQSFVLFKPKDIVSGDFYFFHKNDKSIFIASADCTGHGVPGALMSMIGSEQLDDAVAQSNDPSKILNFLNKGIKTSLRQSDNEESTRDGMDIAFCSIDTENRIVKYAGANRPIWIIRCGQSEVEEIKATKKAIGGLTEDNQHFDTHELTFKKGDTLYLTTDGYADTFGGEGSKKLTTKKFKQILFEIQHMTMQEQELYLDNFIEDWKAGTEQVDDILVIGVRL